MTLSLDLGLSVRKRRMTEMKGRLARDSKDEVRIRQRLQFDLGLSAKKRKLTEMKGRLA